MVRTQEQYQKLVEANTLYRVVTGSTAHRLSVKTSDVDEKGLFQLPPSVYFTLEQEFETLVLHEPSDVEMHSLKKFVQLLRTQNPTVSEMIWTPEKNILVQSKQSDILRENRSLFLSSNAYHSFGGYAKRQLMRIKGGLDRLTDEDKVVHLDDTVKNMIRSFDAKYTEASNGTLSLNEVMLDEGTPTNLNLSIHYDRISLKQMNAMLSELAHALKSYNKMGNRNTRKSEGKLFKHAMHLIRLLLVGTELLNTGVLLVDCGKWKPLLLDIRNEKYTWDDIFDMIATFSKELDDAYAHTDLPPTTDGDKIEELYRTILLDFYGL